MRLNAQPYGDSRGEAAGLFAGTGLPDVTPSCGDQRRGGPTRSKPRDDAAFYASVSQLHANGAVVPPPGANDSRSQWRVLCASPRVPPLHSPTRNRLWKTRLSKCLAPVFLVHLLYMATALLARLKTKRLPMDAPEARVFAGPAPPVEAPVPRVPRPAPASSQAVSTPAGPGPGTAAPIVDVRDAVPFDRGSFMALLASPAPARAPTVPAEAPAPAPGPKGPAAKPTTGVKKKRPPSKKLKLVPRVKPVAPKGVAKTVEGPSSLLKIGDASIGQRTKSKPQIQIRASSYYLSNREIFVNFMTSLFEKYKRELGLVDSATTCERDESTEFQAMGHQKLVRDYLALYSPYRGLLLYHGLGSGKTCSSIAIAEGLKSTRQVVVMVPASLRMNYIEELKKCGDSLYRKNQHWDFIPARGNAELVASLSEILAIPQETIRSMGGAWLMNASRPPNFELLDAESVKVLDKQLNAMIAHKYKFINYNGMRENHLKEMSKNYTINPFDGKAVVVDEAHNFVSRIVNKMKKPDSLSMRLYEYMQTAERARIVFLTGTPIINYPNEIGVLFNMLRGKIKTWTFKLAVSASRKINAETFKKLFKSTVLGGNVMDYMDYKPSTATLTVTRNPFGFVNKTSKGVYKGVRMGERGELSDDEFVASLERVLNKESIKIVPGATSIVLYKALPDTLEEFNAYFIDEDNEVKNMGLFKRRILGLVSYFRDITSLMPRFNKSTDFRVVKVPMSDFQFGVYEEARMQERKLELQNSRKRNKAKAKGKDGQYEETVSTYRIFSRAFCNFVFPRPAIGRPLPANKQNIADAILEATADEDLLDAATAETRAANVDGRYEADEAQQVDPDETYEEQILSALSELEERKEEFLLPAGLQTFSPKFLAILEKVSDPGLRGIHLIYSQFRTLEGVGILRLVFLANGYAEFKAARTASGWRLAVPEADRKKPMFALYTGTESPEEREIVRNVLSSTWKFVPGTLVADLKAIAPNNKMGEIIKMLMITASGAEGISLRNVRYVHITEPYWHPVRIEQVIGRARRICSHQGLPDELRTVEVFLYLMAFSDRQLESDEAIELRLKDKSKIDNLTPVTSDQHLYEIATLKADVTAKLLEAMREASIDCALHAKAGDPNAPKCFTFGSVDPDKFATRPSYADEESDVVAERNKTVVELRTVELEMDGVKYALERETNKVFDLESVKRKEPVQVGTLVVDGARYEYRPI